MSRKFIAAWIATFVAWMAGSFLVHGTILMNDYGGLPNLYRTEADSMAYMPFMLLAHVIMAGAFVWIYARGIEAGAWMGQGIRYGLAIVMLAVVAPYMIYYAVQPLPGMMVVKQIVFDGILVILLGMIVAWFYRQPAAA